MAVSREEKWKASDSVLTIFNFLMIFGIIYMMFFIFGGIWALSFFAFIGDLMSPKSSQTEKKWKSPLFVLLLDEKKTVVG